MSQEFQATYEHGVLRPDAPLALPEHARVVGSFSKVEDLAASTVETAQVSIDELDRTLEELSLDVRPLPADFSRADIYLDHD